MTGLELLNSFNIESETYQSGKDKNFYTSQIEYFLNKAQDNIFESYHQEYEKNGTMREGLDKLNAVVILDSDNHSTTQAGKRENGTIWDMPVLFGYSTSERAIDPNGREIPIKPIQEDYYNTNIINPYKKPNQDLIWRVDHGLADGGNVRRRELITDGIVDVSKYYITFVRRPSHIDVTDNTTPLKLGEKPLKELVTEAVRIAFNVKKNKIYPQQKIVENSK